MIDADPAPARQSPPTIRDVAREAGVTVGTASKALNGRGQLRAETRDRVRAAAAHLEFRPNDLVKSLLRGRTYTVGLLSSAQGRFSLPLLTGIEDALGTAEIMVFFCHVDADSERERKDITSLLAKQVDGLIVMGGRTDPRRPIDVGRSRVPIVYAYTHVADPNALCLLPDDAQGARLAIDHLVGRGRRRIAHITGPDDFQAVHERRAGVVDALAAHGLSLPPERFWGGSWGEGGGYLAVDELLDRAPDIDAIFCGNDQLARGAIDALRERGRRVPADVAVVGFDNWEVLAEAARPPLTTVDMNLHDLGQEAARHLLAMVAGDRPTGTHHLPCTLVVRAS